MKTLTILYLLFGFLISNTFANSKTSAYQNHLSKQKYHKTLGVNMAYRDEGQGPAILLLHGVPTSSFLYRNVITELVELGYRVIAPDLIGFGSSSKPKNSNFYKLDMQAKNLIGLMDSLGVQSWTQVVHDMSGPISWEMLSLAPNKIENFVLLNTFAYKKGWNAPIDLGKRKLIKKVMEKNLKRKKMGGFITRFLIACGISNKKIFRKENALEGYRTPIFNGAHRAILDFLVNFERLEARLPFYQQTIRDNKRPTLVIWGKRDNVLKGKKLIPQFKKDMNIKSENIHILKAKHFIQEEQPKKVARLIHQFLN